MLAAAYRTAWGAPRAVRDPAPEPPQIDLQSNPVLEAQPMPRAAGPSDPRAIKVAYQLAPIVDDAAAVTLSATRLLDRQGIVVGGRSDLGFSYAGLPEVRRALRGHSATVLRRRGAGDHPYGMPTLIELISSGAAIRVHHVRPVIVDVARGRRGDGVAVPRAGCSSASTRIAARSRSAWR
ncbi:MAG: hypothetical protein WDN24_01945 [Sphingomonas sp.]